MDRLFWPIHGSFVITQRFGENPGTYSTAIRPDGSHNGIDLASRPGDKLYPIRREKIVRADMDATGYGLHVRGIAADGAETIYGHMQAIYAKIGDQVDPSMAIGELGSTGNSSGPHVHLEFRTRAELASTAIDIEKYLVKWDPALLDQPVEQKLGPALGDQVTVVINGLALRKEPGKNGGLLVRVSQGMVFQNSLLPRQIVDGIEWVPVVCWMGRGYEGEEYLE
jgi:murein DD-endopeptidase MepM/ murein hydrolase activator NlpD